MNVYKYRLFWSPEGKPIAVVVAKNMEDAIKKAPKPYKQFPGEIYAELISEEKIK